MNFFNWFQTSPKLKRPSNPMIDTFACFDISHSELCQATVIHEQSMIRLQTHCNYGSKCYELLYKRNQNATYQYYSVFRSNDADNIEMFYKRLQELIHPLVEEIDTRCFLPDAPVPISELIQIVYIYDNWTSAHIAAHAALAGAFKRTNHQIIANINAQAKPLRRTPLMLATLSGDIDTVKAILALYPDLEKLDRRLNSVLHFAAICEKEIFRTVIKHCLKRVGKKMLYQRNNRNATPLHFACYSEAIDNVLYMLRLNLDAECLVLEPPINGKANKQLMQNRWIGAKSNCIRNSRLKIVNETHQDLLPIQIRPTIMNMESIASSPKSDEKGKFPTMRTEKKVSKEKLENNEVIFTDEMIEDLDLEDIKHGGSPLHWCMYRRSLERLLQYDLPLNAIDLNHETALFRCVSKHRLRCMLYLLNAGADPNIQNLVGNTCLHEAVLKADIPAVQALVCWDCDLNIKNNAGHTARHLASVANSTNHRIIVYVLHAVGAKRCDPQATGCTEDCSSSASGIGQKFSKWADFERPSPLEHYLNDWSILKKQIPIQNKKYPISRMICFDGGGTKGLITLQILLELQKRLKKPLHYYFDWMVGTSTGSIIASLLALGYSLKAIQIIYYALKDRVMVGQRPYSSSSLEHVLRNILGPHVKMSDVRKKLLITATLADRSPIQLHLFRSFPPPSELLKNDQPNYVDKSTCYVSTKINSDQNASGSTSDLYSEFQPLATCSHYFDTLNHANPLCVIRKLNDILSKASIQSSTDVSKSTEILKEHNKSKDVATEVSDTLSQSFQTTPVNVITEPVNQSSSFKVKFGPLPDYREQLLWQACRSSGAAPTFFRASGAFIDGGLIANNPCLDALTAFTKHNTALQAIGRIDEIRPLQLLLSIGTGKPPVVPAEVIDVGSLYSLNPYEPYQSALQALNLTQEMMAMATQTDAHVVERAHAWCRSTGVLYFRLNPPISENLQLNVLEESEIVNALWESRAYLHAQTDYIDLLVQTLDQNID